MLIRGTYDKPLPCFKGKSNWTSPPSDNPTLINFFTHIEHHHHHTTQSTNPQIHSHTINTSNPQNHRHPIYSINQEINQDSIKHTMHLCRWSSCTADAPPIIDAPLLLLAFIYTWHQCWQHFLLFKKHCLLIQKPDNSKTTSLLNSFKVMT